MAISRHSYCFVTFDLGTTVNVTGFRLWNSSWFTGGGSVSVQDFQLFADVDNDPTNGLGPSLGTFSAANTGGPHAMQTFNTTPGITQFVQMQILSNYGGSGSGFSEGAFAITAVPEPATVALIGTAAAGFGLAWRFRRARRRVRRKK